MEVRVNSPHCLPSYRSRDSLRIQQPSAVGVEITSGFCESSHMTSEAADRWVWSCINTWYRVAATCPSKTPGGKNVHSNIQYRQERMLDDSIIFCTRSPHRWSRKHFFRNENSRCLMYPRARNFCFSYIVVLSYMYQYLRRKCPTLYISRFLII